VELGVIHSPSIDTKLPLGLVQGVFDCFVPCVGSLSIGANMEQVAALLARIRGYFQFDEWREGADAFPVRYRVLRQAGMMLMSESHSFDGRHLWCVHETRPPNGC
jgi:hypothetical protein